MIFYVLKFIFQTSCFICFFFIFLKRVGNTVKDAINKLKAADAGKGVRSGIKVDAKCPIASSAQVLSKFYIFVKMPKRILLKNTRIKRNSVIRIV